MYQCPFKRDNLDIFEEVIADLNFGEDEVELPVLVCLLVRVEGAGRHQELHQLALLAHAELAALGLGVQPLGLPTRHRGEGGEANKVRGVAKAMFASYFPKYFNREPGAIKVYSKLNLEIPKYSTFNVQTFLPDFRIFNRQIKSKPTLRLSLAPTSMPSSVLSPRHQLMTYGL